MKTKIGIIGGGPAGIVASGIAASKGNEVILLEKNERLGKKLFITGKGRCNITNASPIEDFFENVITNKEFLYSSFYTFNNEDVLDLLKKYGLKTKVERGNRVFPESDKSSDVIKAFESFLNNNNVKVHLNTKVLSVEKDKDKFIVTADKEIFYFDKLIIATGGKSYPATGSTGDGYTFAERLGHSIIGLKPSLVPMEINEPWIKDLMGLSLRNVNLKAYYMKKLINEEFGELLFTHYGISGPIVLSMSNHINKYNKPINLSIDLKPALDFEKINNRILRDFEKYSNKQISNSLNDLLPQKIIPWILKHANITPEKKVNQITKEERINLANSIKDFSMDLKGFRPIEEAIVTSGGISTKEIDPSTMESKLVKDLYFAGEIIDVDALTGGYNLQIAYSTGYLSGINI